MLQPTMTGHRPDRQMRNRAAGRRRWRRRSSVVGFGVVVVASLVAAPRPSAAEATLDAPTKVGAWIQPFEEGGAGVPRCHTVEQEGWENGQLVCKPTAVEMAALPDGRVLYWNGFEGYENVDQSALTQLAPRSHNAQARVLDLRGGTPVFSTPSPATGGGVNKEKVNQRWSDDPLGTAGVPGRPGDGLVGSTAGRLGGPEHRPSNSPNDHDWNDLDLFCSDLAGMADGRVLIAGGTDWYNEPSFMQRSHGDPADVGLEELGGLRTTRIFDPATNTFSEAGDMHHPRWYPTLLELPDGKFLVASGVTKFVKSTQLSSVRRTETFDPATNRWTENYAGPQSENSLPFIARLHLMPNGKILYAGGGEMWAPLGQAADEALWGLQQLYDPASKTWAVAGLAPFGMPRDIPSSVLLPLKPPYDKGTVLMFGGALGPSPGGSVAVPLSTRTTVDAAGHVTNEMTGNLNEARWSPAGIPLPDGTVLALAGARNSHTATPGFDIPVHSAEIYDPATGKWTKVAPQARDRSYHYSATLLADGRVLLGGWAPIGTLGGPHRTVGGPFANNNRDSSFEIYSPPYLFRGPRPKISHAPAGIAWGETFELGVPNASDIQSVMLIKPPTKQHATDSNTRSVELAFHRTGPDRLEVVAPPGGTVAPPGAYYLFVNRQNPGGLTPSVARTVFVGDHLNDAEAIQPFPDDFAGITGGSATAVTGGPRGEDTYLGPAGTTVNGALGAATPALAAVEEINAQKGPTEARSPSSASGPSLHDAQQRRPVVLLIPLVLGAAALAGALTTRRPAAASPTLAALGKDLFFSTTAWGQQPSHGPEVAGQRLACASCHTGPAYTDGRTHLIAPVGAQPLARRQTSHLFGLCCTAPYSWDRRNTTLQAQLRGAIVSPLEINAAREPTHGELDALAEFLLTLAPPKAEPGVDFDPAKATRGEQLFRQLRPVTDPGGEFGPHANLSCATCHEGPRFTDNKPHRIWPTPFGDPADRGEVNRDGHTLGFDTPELTAVRLTAPYFHQGGGGVESAPADPGAARQALQTVVLPYYNARFQLRFTDAELDDLTEFLLSL